jgi:hypothetical protein
VLRNRNRVAGYQHAPDTRVAQVLLHLDVQVSRTGP